MGARPAAYQHRIGTATALQHSTPALALLAPPGGSEKSRLARREKSDYLHKRGAVRDNAVELIRHWEKPIKIGLCVVYVVVLSAAAGLFLLH